MPHKPKHECKPVIVGAAIALCSWNGMSVGGMWQGGCPSGVRGRGGSNSGGGGVEWNRQRKHTSLKGVPWGSGRGSERERRGVDDWMCRHGTVCVLEMNMWTVRFFKIKLWSNRCVQTEMRTVRIFKMKMWTVQIFKMKMRSVRMFILKMWTCPHFQNENVDCPPF